jgi:hypothetical protein
MEHDAKIKRRFFVGLVVGALVAFGTMITAWPTIKGWMEIAMTPGSFR